MPYATIDDVQARMPQFQLSAITKPTMETAQVFLDDVHAHYEAAMMNLGYVLPITGRLSLAQSRNIVCHGTIARVLYARGAGTGGDAALQSAKIAQDAYDKALKELADPKHPSELTDAVRNTSEQEKPGSELDGLLTDSDGNALEPRITMCSQF